MLPVIVVAHGGPCGGCRGYLTQLSSVMALEGAVVFNVDYRDGENKRNASYRDLACAVAFARENAADFGGDPERVTLVGHSLGSIRGAIEALTNADKPGPCKAKGPGVPDSFAGLSVAPATSVLDRAHDLHRIPVRLFVGAKDQPGFQSSMTALQAYLVTHGVDSTLTRVPDADHYSVFDLGTATPTVPAILALASGR
jgi:arylformamidase